MVVVNSEEPELTTETMGEVVMAEPEAPPVVVAPPAPPALPPALPPAEVAVARVRTVPVPDPAPPVAEAQ
jgi:hypothetical protein